MLKKHANISAADEKLYKIVDSPKQANDYIINMLKENNLCSF